MSLGVERNGLVAGIETGHVALAAVDAEVVVDDRELLLLRHVVDVFEEVASRASNVFESGHLPKVDLLRFLSFLPETKVVNVLLQRLAVFDRRGLPFPSLLSEILTSGKEQRCSQSTIQILNNAEILLLDGGSDLEHRTSTKFGIGECMLRIDDTSSSHNFCIFEGRIVCQISGYSQSYRSQD